MIKKGYYRKPWLETVLKNHVIQHIYLVSFIMNMIFWKRAKVIPRWFSEEEETAYANMYIFSTGVSFRKIITCCLIAL